MTYLLSKDTNANCVGLNCNILSEQYLFSEKSVDKGKWYYEIEHISGDFMFASGFTLYKEVWGMGFAPYKLMRCEDNRIGRFFYNNNSIFSDEISYQGCITNSNFSEKDIYGIGIDIDSNVFIIKYKNQIYRIGFKIKPNSIRKFNAWVIQAVPGRTLQDNFTINFGSIPFKYEIPYGYQPFISPYINPITCRNDNYYLHHFLLFPIQIFITI